MKAKGGVKKSERDQRMADPEVVLKAANSAPTVFSIGPYFLALYVMRKKGHSWRYLADEWLKRFNIEISHVHLHRLYTKEDARLDKLTATELRELGMPEDMIKERLSKDDPTKRLIAADPDEEATEETEDDQ